MKLKSFKLFLFLATVLFVGSSLATSGSGDCADKKAFSTFSETVLTNNNNISFVHYNYKGKVAYVRASGSVRSATLKESLDKYDRERSGCVSAPVIIALPKLKSSAQN
jgi:hypothetical protein